MGAAILLTGILGFFTALCRNSGINCLFATPFIILAFIGTILLVVAAAITSGADGAIMDGKDKACAAEFSPGVSISDKVNTEYTKLVDKNLCSAVCQCPLSVQDIWEDVPENRTR